MTTTNAPAEADDPQTVTPQARTALWASLVGTLLSFATFAVGFVVRPIGGFVFGHIGDRIGRKRTPPL